MRRLIEQLEFSQSFVNRSIESVRVLVCGEAKPSRSRIKTSTRHGCKLGIFNRFFIENALPKNEVIL